MSRTTASDGSWMLIHHTHTTHMTTPTLILHMLSTNWKRPLVLQYWVVFILQKTAAAE